MTTHYEVGVHSFPKLNWDALSDFEQLVLLQHAQTSEHRFLGMINAAYCDESETQQDPPVYVVSGYLAKGPDWFEFSRRWSAALIDEGLEQVGFHMAWCEHGNKAPYDAMPSVRRRELQQRFINIINASALWAYATAIDLAAYAALADRLKAIRRELWKPYYLAFQHTVELMARVLEDNGFARTECVAFMFDEQKEYEGKAKILYDRMRQADNMLGHRLGSLTFADDTKCVPLQAADLWAYESRAFFRDHHVRGLQPREQFLRLRSVRNPNNFQIKYFGEEELARWAERYGL